jgi:hypothetical protein
MADGKDKPIDAMTGGTGDRAARRTSRRGFIKIAILSGVAVAATATAAKR